MRLTKGLLKQTKIRLDERIKDVFKRPDEEIVILLKHMFPNAVPGTREENIRMILLLSVDEIIPAAWHD